MRVVVAGALLALTLGFSSCSQDPGKTITNSKELLNVIARSLLLSFLKPPDGRQKST